MLDPDLKFVFGDSYSDDFFSNGAKYRETLNKEGILIFNSFIGTDGLKALQNEAKELKEYSYKVPQSTMLISLNMIILFQRIVHEIEL